jgi:hypothetical protein
MRETTTCWGQADAAARRRSVESGRFNRGGALTQPGSVSIDVAPQPASGGREVAPPLGRFWRLHTTHHGAGTRGRRVPRRIRCRSGVAGRSLLVEEKGGRSTLLS